MKQQVLLTIVFLAITSLAFSQVSFEKGYFIDNSDKKVECLIRNAGWKQNPSQIEYKLTEEGKSEVATIDEIKEFSLPSIGKFQRHNVNIEKSVISKNVNQLSVDPEPEFSEELLFLRVLLEGKATLFTFHGKNIMKYFYSIDNELPKQLVYKVYRNDNNELRKNNEFRKQLYLHLNCTASPIQNLDQIDYAKKELIKVFIDFNKCEESEFIQLDKKQRRGSFNLSVKGGVDFTSFLIYKRSLDSEDIDFGNAQNIRLGAELEFILPINQNKWSIFLEPTYQSFKATTEEIIAPLTVREVQTVDIDYRSIETTLGFRYYTFLNSKSKVFVNGGFAFDRDRRTVINFQITEDLPVQTFGSFIAGAGYNLRDKLSIEFRYTNNKSLLEQYEAWDSKYSKVSIIAGYNFF